MNMFRQVGNGDASFWFYVALIAFFIAFIYYLFLPFPKDDTKGEDNKEIDKQVDKKE